MNFMQYYTKQFWGKSQQEKNIIFPIRTIVHPCLDVMSVTEVKQIPRILCNINQAHKALQRCPIRLTDSNHYQIIDEMKHRDTFEYDLAISYQWDIFGNISMLFKLKINS